MRKVILRMNVTLDGFVATTSGAHDWVFRSFDEELEKYTVDQFWQIGTHIMGRRTYDAMAAHFDAELGIDPDALTSPWHAAFASCVAFLSGALIPLLAVVLAPASIKIPFVFVAVLLALVLTGAISAKIGKARVLSAVIRVVLGGALAMAATYGIGRLVGVAGL